MPLRFRTTGMIGLNTPAWVEMGQDQSCSDFALRQTSAGFGANCYRVKSIGDWPSKASTFRAMVKEGRIIMSPMTITEELKESKGNTYLVLDSVAPTCGSPVRYAKYTESGKLFAYMHGAYLGSQMLTLLDQGATARLQKQVTTRALAERGRFGANLIESLAEMDQVWSMLHRPLENILQYSRTFDKRRRKGSKVRRGVNRAGDFAQFANSEWLRYRYGIRPLLDDLNSVWGLLARAYGQEPILYRTKSHGSISRPDVQKSSLSLGVLTVQFEQRNVHSFSVRVTLVDRLKRTPFKDLGFTLKNLIGLPWELTRLSFVADWFVNIGDVIYANVPDVDLEYMGGVCTTLDTRDATFVPTGTSCTSAYKLSGQVADSKHWVYSVKDRTKVLPSNSDVVVMSDFRLDHFTRAADAFALFMQQMRQIAFSFR